MSVKYSLILKEDDFRGITVCDNDLISIDYGTSHYTEEKLFNKYFDNTHLNASDNHFKIRYKYQKLHEIPCIFNDKYIALITNPKLEFFKRQAAPNPRRDYIKFLNSHPEIDETSLVYNEDIALFYPKSELGIKNNYSTFKKIENFEEYQYGFINKKNKKDPTLMDTYAVVANRPSLVLTKLVLKYWDIYRYEFEYFYNRELMRMVTYDPTRGIKKSNSNYSFEKVEKNDYEFVDYFRTDPKNKNKLAKDIFFDISCDLDNYTRFRKCYWILKKFHTTVLRKPEEEFVEHFMNTIEYKKMETLKVPNENEEFEQTSLFKKNKVN